MIAKVLDTFLRHKWLMLLPPILIPTIATPILVMFSVSYETRAAIWVDRPAYLRQTNDDYGRMTTPAQAQGARLNELLRSRTFLMDVAAETPLAPLIGSTKGEDKILAMIEKGLLVAPSGNNLLVITFEAPTQEISFEVVSGLVEKFQANAMAGRRDQGEQAIAFYQERVQAAEDQLAKSNEVLRRYVASNPRLSASDRNAAAVVSIPSRPSDPAAATIDPRLAELRARVELDERDVERARSSLDEAQLNVSASLQGQELGFQVIDPPRMPTEPKRGMRRILIYPIAGVVAGLGLSVALLLLLVVTDRSARTEVDLAQAYPVLAVVPQLHFDDLLANADSEAARRAIGLLAMSVLPASTRSEGHGSPA
jgi:uncharacterized protein involved in exopolysaccharide biosynthesis